MDQTVKGWNDGFDRINVLVASLTTFVTFIILYLTVSRTISYWDCGEFVACAHLLGNPHPPGSPVFVLIGRAFDILHLVEDVAFRINLMSVLASSCAALFAYLIIVKLIMSWYKGKEEQSLGRYIAYASGFIGAMFMAFGRTQWGNSVEAEVYSLSMALMLIMFWLALRWFDHRYDAAGQRIAILVSFLAMFSVGLHLTVFLVIPFVVIFMCLKEDTTRTDWAIVAGFIVFEVLLIMVLSTSYGMYKVFLAITGILIIALAIYLRQKIYWPVAIAFASILPIMSDFKSFMIAMVAGLVITVIMFIVKRTGLWRLAMLMVLAGALGWSVHLYIPIRSAQHPLIDENTPSRSFQTFVDFLDRKQYGSMAMTERMFERRGSWGNQLGDHARMGYWGFFKEQYSSSSTFPLFFLIGLYGLAVLAQKNPSRGYILIAFVIVASVGMVVYMNFADGTRFSEATGDAYQEVRDRDYFFNPAFVLFGMVIGLGMGAVMEAVRRYGQKLGFRNQRLAVMTSLVLVLTTIVPIQANYYTNDRSRNRMAYDYAYNMLASCEKDAILFTSGDNDTFPLWGIQAVYDFRRDVRVVNFSLLNTDWYNWQLKHFKKVPISMEDDQILWNPYTLPDGTEIVKPDKTFNDRARKRQTWLIPMAYQGQTMKVASMMLDDIILSNNWRFPVYFSSASGEVRGSPLKLLDHSYRDGLLLRLSRDESKLAFDEKRTDSLFFKVYKYTNLDDTLVAQDENATGIALVYPEKALDYSTYLYRLGDTARADSVVTMIGRKIPFYWRSRLAERDIALRRQAATPALDLQQGESQYMQGRRADSIRALAIEQELLQYLQGYLNLNPGNIFFYQFLGMANYAIGNRAEAERLMTEAWVMNHDKEPTFRALLAIYPEDRRAAEMIRVAKEYLEYQRQDQMANEVVRNASVLMQAPPPPPDLPGGALPGGNAPPVRVGTPGDPGKK